MRSLAHSARVARVAWGTLAVAASVASAQRPQPKPSFDRGVAPTPGKTPELHVPSWTKVSLSNGAQLVVVPRHTLPLVSFNISFSGGSYQFAPASKSGVGTFLGSMLSEGTTTKTGDQLSNAMQLLGSTVEVNVGGESASLGFLAMKDKLAPMLAILEDMVVNPTFPPEALERLRGRTLISLQQAKDRTRSIAGVVFPKTIYTTAHPYGRSMTEESAKAITRDDIVALHKQLFQPGRAVITVVGDVNPAEVKQTVERVLGPLGTGGATVAFTYPPVDATRPTAIYLVDKAGAAQSSFRIGVAGPPRNTPDYYALRVMSQLLGELFQSRLNANIRESKGYSYGISSGIQFGHGPGAIITAGDVVTAKSDSALIEWMKEIRGIRGDRPITDDELAAGKAALTQGLLEEFASTRAVSDAIRAIYLENLPENYYQQFASNVNAVTKEDVVRVARKYLDPDHLTIVIVGDRKTIEAPLAATKIAPIVVLDVNGDPVKP